MSRRCVVLCEPRQTRTPRRSASAERIGVDCFETEADAKAAAVMKLDRALKPNAKTLAKLKKLKVELAGE